MIANTHRVVLSRYISDEIKGRELVSNIFSDVPENSLVSIDFESITFISRNAADELVEFFEDFQKKGIGIELVNIGSGPKKMLELVTKSRSSSSKRVVPNRFDRVIFSNEIALDNYLCSVES